jgi:hypothetical protein
MAVVALALAGVALVTVQLAQRFPARAPALRVLVSALCLSAGVHALWRGFPAANLAQFHAPDLFDEIRYRALPERSRVVLTTPQSVFRHYGAQAVERLRPDVAMVPLPFLDYGAAGEQLARKHPELAPLIRGYLATQALSHPALARLREQRRVLIELDSSFTLPLYPWLLPNGLYYELQSDPPNAAACAEAALRREALLDWLYEALADDAHELETRRQLLWIHYTDALYYAQRGLRDQALRASQRGLALEPQARELVALAKALRDGIGAVDIRPFLVGI